MVKIPPNTNDFNAFLSLEKKKTNNKKGKQANEVNNGKLNEETKKEKKIPLHGFSLRRYVVTRYAVTRFTNNRPAPKKGTMICSSKIELADFYLPSRGYRILFKKWISFVSVSL